MIGIGYQLLHATLLDQCDGGTEGTEFLKTRHVNTIIVGITDLRRTRYHHNLLWMQTVKNLEDTLFQRSTAHNRVVDYHQIILVCFQRTITDIIDMCCKIITLGVIGNEGTQLDVFPHHLLRPHVPMKFTEAVCHTIEGHLGSIRDIGEYSMIHIIVNGPENSRCKLLTQTFALLINIAIRSSTEIDTLKRTGAQLLSRHNLFQPALTVFMHDECLTRLKLTDIFRRQIKRRLEHRTLTGKGYNLVITIIERRTNPPGIPHSEHLTRTCQSAHHITTVEMLHRCPQHISHLNVIIDIVCDVRTCQSLFFGDGI